jgi:hypothetical protein
MNENEMGWTRSTNGRNEKFIYKFKLENSSKQAMWKNNWAGGITMNSPNGL